MEYKLPFVLWRDGLKGGKLLGLKCKDCGTVTCPPRKVCAECASENLDVVELKSSGKIKTFTVCYVAPRGFEGPYVVAVVDMEEGGRVMGNVIDMDPTKVDMEIIGRNVQVAYREICGDYMTGGDSRFPLTFKLI